jgi:hypothetical protein
MASEQAGSKNAAVAAPKAMLFTRSSPKIARADEWDKWEVDKHMYDLVRGPGIQSSTMYKRAPNLPQVIRPEPRRAVAYRAIDLHSMRTWLESEVLKEAVEDGRTWRDAYDPVEDEWFTGNVYHVRKALGGYPALASYILFERFEVPAAMATEFDKWLDDYVEQLGALAGVESAQSLEVVRDISNVLYLSPGNRALQATIPIISDPVAILGTAIAAKAFRSSHEWELKLSYQTRELFVPGGLMVAPGEEGNVR